MKGAKGQFYHPSLRPRHDPFEVDGRQPHPRGGRQRRQHHRRRDLDETLDGLIRVSVVATGIDAVATSRAAPAAQAPESRLAELTARLRADNQRMAERALQKQQAATAAPAAAAAAAAPRATADQIDRAALAAIAEASRRRARAGAAAARRIAASGEADPAKPSLFHDHDERWSARAAPPAASSRSPPSRSGPHRGCRSRELRLPAQNRSAWRRRDRRGASAADAAVAPAAHRQCRPRPPRRGEKSRDRGPRPPSGVRNAPLAEASAPEPAAIRRRAVSTTARRPAPQA